MTIVAYINKDLAIRVHRVFGRVNAQQFLDSVTYYRAHPDLARTDLISLIDEAVDVSSFTLSDLDVLRGAFQELYDELKIEVVLRSAWVCPSVRAWPLVEEWLRDRHSRDHMATEVCLVTRLDEADCLFDPSELAALRTFAGFAEFARF